MHLTSITYGETQCIFFMLSSSISTYVEVYHEFK